MINTKTKKVFCLFVGLMAFAVIFTGCGDPKPELTNINISVEGIAADSILVNNVLEKLNMKIGSETIDLIKDKANSKIKDLSYTLKELVLGNYTISFDAQYKNNTNYVIDKVKIDAKEYDIDLSGKLSVDPLSIKLEKTVCAITIVFRSANDIDRTNIALDSDQNLSKWKEDLDLSKIDDSLLSKTWLGFQKSGDKFKWITEPDNEGNHKYMSNSEVAFGWNTGFDSISDGLKKRWKLATTNFIGMGSPYFLNLNEAFTVTKNTCDSEVGKFRHCIINDEYYALKIAKYGSDNKYYVYYDAFISGCAFHWVVVAIHKEGKNLPDYVIEAPITNFSDIKDMYANNYYDSNNIPVGFNYSDGKIALFDLLDISNDSVNIIMDPENYELYAVVLDSDGETDGVFQGKWNGFRNVIQLNDPNFQW